jgi:glycosyltransferase involved in cell wall biosynthesis
VSPLSICFVAPHGEGALRARYGQPTTTGFGGAEVQMALLGSGLAERGHSVSFICTGNEQRQTTIGKIRALVLDEKPGSFQRRMSEALRSSGASIAYQRCAQPLTGRLAWECRRAGLKFVFAVANDRDLDGRARSVLGWRRYLLYRYGRARADLIIVQSRHQERLLGSGHNRGVYRLPSAFDLRGIEQRPDPAVSTVLWVANLLPKKRPLDLLEIARRMPECRFVAAGAETRARDLARRFYTEAESLANVDYRGRVEPSAMGALYHQATVLLNTSEAEGVPNTFLEAWARGVPVVTLGVDPDGLISRNGLGLCLGEEDPVPALRSYLADREARAAAGLRARSYVEQNHGLGRAIDLFEEALATLA